MGNFSEHTWGSFLSLVSPAQHRSRGRHAVFGAQILDRGGVAGGVLHVCSGDVVTGAGAGESQ